MNSPLLTVNETAEYLKVAKDTIYSLARSKDFPAFKVGREWRIPRVELDLWLQRQLNEKSDYVL